MLLCIFSGFFERTSLSFFCLFSIMRKNARRTSEKHSFHCAWRTSLWWKSKNKSLTSSCLTLFTYNYLKTLMCFFFQDDATSFNGMLWVSDCCMKGLNSECCYLCRSQQNFCLIFLPEEIKYMTNARRVQPEDLRKVVSGSSATDKELQQTETFTCRGKQRSWQQSDSEDAVNPFLLRLFLSGYRKNQGDHSNLLCSHLFLFR